MMQISATSPPMTASAATITRPAPRTDGTGLEGLTASDRSFIQATTGYALAPDTQLAPAVAFDIAADRKVGILTGDVNQGYLDGLMSRQGTSLASQLAAKKDDAAEAAQSAEAVHASYQRWYAAATAYLAAEAPDPNRSAALDVQA